MLSRQHQLAWAIILGVLAILIMPRVYRVLRGDWVSIETPPRYFARFEVDINRADWPELALLPGIGEATAKRIVEFRTRNGPFTRAEDLIQVPGIGPKTFEQIRPYVVVGALEATKEHANGLRD